MKIAKSNLTDKIFDYIKDQILSGKWPVNKKIPSESELAEDLGVSRMSLRMAIQKSNVLGLTETKVGDGTFVRDFNMRSYFNELFNSNILLKDYNTINDFRMILQIGSIRLAFEKSEIEDWTIELEHIYKEMEKTVEANDIQSFHKVDSEFHRCICRLSDNELMYMLYDAVEHTINEVTIKNVEESLKTTGSYDQILNFHKTILDGIKERNIQKCIDAEMKSRKHSISFYNSEDTEKQDQ